MSFGQHLLSAASWAPRANDCRLCDHALSYPIGELAKQSGCAKVPLLAVRRGHLSYSPGAAEQHNGELSQARRHGIELLETWLILEYCDCGSLEEAMLEGKYSADLVSSPPPDPPCNCKSWLAAPYNALRLLQGSSWRSRPQVCGESCLPGARARKARACGASTAEMMKRLR